MSIQIINGELGRKGLRNLNRRIALLSFLALIPSSILLAQLRLTIDQQQNTICLYGNGYIFSSATGGTEPYSFTDNAGVPQADGLFPRLTAGTHVIRVTDAAGQSDSRTITLTNTYINPSLAITGSTKPTDCSTPDGTITVSGSGPGGGFTYSVTGSPFQTSNVLTGVPGGMVTVSVKDANGCQASKQVRLDPTCPDISVTFTSTPAVCQPTGKVDITSAVGPNLPFEYKIDPGGTYSNSTSLTGIAAGTHKLFTKDQSGTELIQTFTINKSCNLTVTAASTEASCAQANGSITVTATGGGAPYFYSSGGNNFQESNVLTGLAGGTYTISVKDAIGGTGILTGVVVGNGPAAPTLNLTGTATSCNVINGRITAVAAGGNGGFSYQLNNGTAQGSGVFNGIAAGDYTIKVTDNRGCSAQKTITITSATGPTLVANSSPTGCSVNNGSITAVATGGAAPLNYRLNNGTAQASGNFTGLAANSYIVTVTDGNGCSENQTLIVQTATGPSITTSSTNSGCSVNNGTITIETAGGTAPFRFQLNNGAPQTSGNFNGLNAGTYTALVTDQNGCTASEDVAVGTTSGPSLTATAGVASCSGNDGTVTASGNGGLAPLQYRLDQGQLLPNGNFSGVSGGDHSVTVIDANGCSASETVTVSVANGIALNAGPDIAICSGDSTQLAGTSSAPAVWSPSLGLEDVQNLKSNARPARTTKYYLTAKSGVCSSIDSVTITVRPLPIAEAGSDATVCYLESTTLKGAGGTAFTWTPSTFLDNDHSASPKVINPNQTSRYLLTVIDENGCVSNSPDEVTVTVIPQAKVFAGNDTAILKGTPFQLAAIDVNNSGFNQYSWSPPIGLDNANISNPIATLSAAQQFNLTAKTPEGCSASDQIFIKVFNEANLFVPNAFSPNNDGINDQLHVIPIGMRSFSYFAVFNRYGQQVFFTKDPGAGWDGRINGQFQNQDVFVWKAEGTTDDGQLVRRTGTVVLVQ